MSGEPDLHVVLGTGPVGTAVIGELLARGRRVRAVNRSGSASLTGAAEQVEVLAGDLTNRVFARQAAAGAAVVYSCVNVPYGKWPELFPRLQASVVEAASSAEAKLVVIENLYMYGPTGGKPLTERLPYLATGPKGTTRARMAEELMRAHGKGKVRVAIGRASDFFGPGVLDAAAGARLFYPALRGEPVTVLGEPRLRHTYSFVPDVGKALVVLGERPEAAGEIWHLPSPETVSTREFVQIIAAECGHPVRLKVAGEWLLRFVGFFNSTVRQIPEIYYQWDQPWVVDHGKFAAAFGDHATPLPDAIRQTVAWFRANPQGF